MEDAAAGERLVRDLLRAVQHVHAGVAVEDEVALSVRLQGHEREAGPRLRMKRDEAGVDARAGQRLSKEMTERVLAHFPQERGVHAQPRQPDRHVRGRASRRLAEARTLIGDVRGVRHEVDEGFTQANGLSAWLRLRRRSKVRTFESPQVPSSGRLARSRVDRRNLPTFRLTNRRTFEPSSLIPACEF